MTNSINLHFRSKIPLHIIQILNPNSVLIDFAKQNLSLKYFFWSVWLQVEHVSNMLCCLQEQANFLLQ